MLSITQTCTFERQRDDVYSMETKLEYLLDSSSTLNMFDIQEYWNKIFQKDGQLHSKIDCEHWAYSAMQYWELYFFRFASALKLGYFSDLLGFKHAHFYL